MGKTNSVPQGVPTVFMALDLAQLVERGQTTLQVRLQVPGRDGLLTRKWLLGNHLLDANQASDIVAWVSQSTQNALVRWFGVEERLPM